MSKFATANLRERPGKAGGSVVKGWTGGPIVRTSPIKGSNATYREAEGATGGRFAAWRAGRAKRYCDRFAVGQVNPHDEQAREERRVMRNARKQEAAK